MKIRKKEKKKRSILYNESHQFFIFEFVYLVITCFSCCSFQAVCVVVAMMLQYFFLAGFCWMFGEAVVLYFYVVRVFNFEIKLRWFYMFFWG